MRRKFIGIETAFCEICSELQVKYALMLNLMARARREGTVFIQSCESLCLECQLYLPLVSYRLFPLWSAGEGDIKSNDIKEQI